MQETIQPGSARTLYASTVTSRVTSQRVCSYRSKMLLSTVIFCLVAIYLSSAKPDWTDLKSSESDNEGLSSGNRIKRAPIGIAVQAFLAKATFAKRSGFDKIFYKRGGHKTAVEDFNKLNTSKKVTVLPNEGTDTQLMGKAGKREIILSEDTKSGLTIIKISNVRSSFDSLFTNIIVYTD